MVHNTSIRTRRHVGFMMIVTLMIVSIAPGAAFAGVVGTGSVIAEQTSSMNRNALIEQLDREEVRAQLEVMGVDASEAVERVAAMTDSEVNALAAGLGNFPAGADVGLGAAILIILLVVLIIR